MRTGRVEGFQQLNFLKHVWTPRGLSRRKPRKLIIGLWGMCERNPIQAAVSVKGDLMAEHSQSVLGCITGLRLGSEIRGAPGLAYGQEDPPLSLFLSRNRLPS